MNVGYIRVSTQEQNTARQEELMQRLGVEKLYMDKLSGKNTNRPQLQTMLEYVREGDVVIVESYSRLSRSIRDLLEIVDRLKSKGVAFVSQKEKVDTTTPTGELMMNVFASIYQFERACLLERQKEGIDIAKREGRYKGRKPIEIDEKQWKELFTQWEEKKITARAFMQKMNLKANTFYRKVDEWKEKNFS